MGAYSPLPQFSTELGKRCVEEVVRPVIHALRQRDISFCGVLYAGLIMTKTGPKVIEFNVRFGDPETEVVLPQLQSDFYELILGLLAQQPPQVKWQNNDIYLGVFVSSENYPQSSGCRGIIYPALIVPHRPYHHSVLEMGTRSEGRIC